MWAHGKPPVPHHNPFAPAALKGQEPAAAGNGADMDRVKPMRELPRIKVSASPTEREAIVAAAASIGLSTSSYLRRIGAAYRPESRVDLDQVTALQELSTEANRLGILLKWWLTGDPRLANFAHVDMPVKIRQALTRLNQILTQMHAVAASVTKTDA